MNILLWVLQVFMSLHTAMGTVWKVSNSDQVPSLAIIPPAGWMFLVVVEMLCAIGLVLPIFNKRQGGKTVPVAAAIIAVEMLIFCVIHFSSGSTETGQPIYWLVVAAICAFVAYGRKVKVPQG